MTGTTMTVKIPEIDIVLWAQAVTALAGKELPYCWEDWSPRDGELGDPKVDEVIALLPDGAELVFGSENMTKCRVLATCDGAAVQVVAFLDRVNVVTAAGDPVTARQLGREVLDEVHRPPGDKPGDVPLLVWSSTDDQFEVNKVVLSAPRWSEIKGNYPEATRRDLDWLMGRTEGDQTGGGGRLILFHGPPGTGKSFAIQALLNEWEQWCRPEYVVDPKTALLDYKNLHQLLSPARTQDRKGTPGWRIVVAEDADQFIRANHRSPTTVRSTSCSTPPMGSWPTGPARCSSSPPISSWRPSTRRSPDPAAVWPWSPSAGSLRPRRGSGWVGRHPGADQRPWPSSMRRRPA